MSRIRVERSHSLGREGAREKAERLAEIGVEPAPAGSEAFTAQVRQQAELWGGVIRKAGIKLEG